MIACSFSLFEKYLKKYLPPLDNDYTSRYNTDGTDNTDNTEWAKGGRSCR